VVDVGVLGDVPELGDVGREQRQDGGAGKAVNDAAGLALYAGISAEPLPATCPPGPGTSPPRCGSSGAAPTSSPSWPPQGSTPAWPHGLRRPDFRTIRAATETASSS